MGVVTSNMGLKSWPDATDKFSFSDLSLNIRKIDLHDHGSGKGVQLGAAALVDASITGTKLGPDLRATQFSSTALSTDKLASNPLSVPREIMHYSNVLLQSFTTSATTYVVKDGGQSNFATLPAVPFMWTFHAADYAIAGRTTQLTFKGGYATNGTAGGTANVTFGLYPITQTGNSATALGAPLQTFVVPGSLGTNQSATFARVTVTAPVDGSVFGLGIVTGAGTQVSGAVTSIFWYMGLRWV